jgi:hypothetical protein
MREYIFHGKRGYDGEWIEGCLIHQGDHYLILQDESKLHPMDVPYIDDFGCLDGRADPVVPESVGQYTGFDEWMLDDASRDAKLYEGDIVEVWGNREIYGSNWSQYDGKVKFRGVIVFEYGEWRIEFKNKYNEVICKARGKEEYDRDVPWGHELYRSCFHHLKDRDKLRQKKLEDRESCLKWGFDDYSYYDDIVKIGTVFENADLLEG